jgi:carboxymethylenebutenolidase
MGVRGTDTEIGYEGRVAKGYMARPEGEGSHPGLIIVHEWWGLNDHIKDVARRFAAQGYVALVPDIYEGKVTEDPEEAGRLMQGLDEGRSLQVLNAAVSHLQSLEEVDGERIGVTGFCMGGSFALLLPCKNDAIKAAAPFYGDIPADDVLAGLSAPVLFIGAENNFWITEEKMNGLKESLKKLNKEGEVIVYPDVGHAFFNDTRPDAYDSGAAEDAWKRVNQFLAEKLK